MVILNLYASAYWPDPGETIYDESLHALEDGRSQGLPARELSNIALKGAGQCRDEGSYYYALELFEIAIDEDPTNAYVYRVYADYLMGYRGLYEQAGTKYFLAKELVELDPASYDETFKKALIRSLQIWHRDGKDGIPLFDNYSSDDFSIFFTPAIEVRKSSRDQLEPLNLFEFQRRHEGFNDKTIDTITNDPMLDAAAKERFIASERARRAAISERQIRRLSLVEKTGRVRLRFGNENVPYFDLRWTKVDIDPNIVDVETFDEADGVFKGVFLEIGKNYMLSHSLDLNLKATLIDREITGESPFDSSIRVSKEESGDHDFDLQSTFTYFFSTNTLKITLGTAFVDIDRTEEGGDKFSDSANSQRMILRLSQFKTPDETENPTRFRGRRSNHYELGFQRVERDFEGATSYFDLKPNFSMEYLGLIDGHLDLAFNYSWLTRRYKSDVEITPLIPTPFNIKGRYDVHQFGLIPTWVMIYDLYQDSFTRGIEFLSMSAPISYALDEKAGDYTRFNAGLKAESQIVLWNGFRLNPILEGDFAYYPELNRNDWGFFVKCKFSY